MSGFGLLCSGQGNQHKAMFDILAESHQAQAVLQSVVPFFGCHPVEYLQSLSEEELFRNQPAQLLIATLQMATWEALRSSLPAPRVYAGYSLGEVSAYGCAGSLAIDKMLPLIKRRAVLMDAAAPQPSGMLAVRGLLQTDIETLCAVCGVEVAIINGPDHFILGGPAETISQCEQHPLAKQAIQCRRLQVSVPSHTSWMSSAGSLFQKDLESAGFADPRGPVLAGTNGSLIRCCDEAIPALSRQIFTPLNWLACMRTSAEMGCRVMLEMGPGDALKKIMQEQDSRIAVRSVDDFRSVRGVVDWINRQLG